MKTKSTIVTTAACLATLLSFTATAAEPSNYNVIDKLDRKTVNQSLANTQSYAKGAASGFKWGSKSQQTVEATWTERKSTAANYKWGEGSSSEQTGFKWGVR